MTTAAAKRASKKYTKKAYYTFTVYLPRRYEAEFLAAVEAAGVSRNRFILDAVLMRMEKDKQ